MAPVYGITFGPRHYSVHVELPDTYPVLPDAYRQFLRDDGGEQDEVRIERFAELVRSHRPAWLLRQQTEFAASSTVPSLRDEIVELMRSVGMLAPDVPISDEMELPFDLVRLHDEQDIRDRWLQGRAAMYHENTKQLFINLGYYSVPLLAAQLQAEFDPDGKSPELQALALELAERHGPTGRPNGGLWPGQTIRGRFLERQQRSARVVTGELFRRGRRSWRGIAGIAPRHAAGLRNRTARIGPNYLTELANMVDLPKYIIVDRRDLLGGRLVAMLNGLRMSRRIGVPFLMTWPHGDGDFWAYVPKLADIFSGDFTLPFDPTSGRGVVIAADDPRLADATRSRSVIPCPETVESGIDILLVRPNLRDGGKSNYLLDQRFACYALGPEETFADVKAGLAAEFRAIPKAPAIQDAFDQVDRAMAGSQVAALHLRRLHLYSDTYLQASRFNSYCSTKTASAVISSLADRFDTVLIASDNPAVVDTLTDAHPGFAVAANRIIPLDHYPPSQRSLIDMYVLSKASEIFAPVGAFGFSASLIGGGRFRNILRYAAETGITAGDDETESLAFLSASMQPKPEPLARLAASVDGPGKFSMNDAGLLLHIAGALAKCGLHEQARDFGVWSCALRATQHSSRQDIRDFPLADRPVCQCCRRRTDMHRIACHRGSGRDAAP